MFTTKRQVVILTVLLGIFNVPNSLAASENARWWENVQGTITIGKKEFLLGEPIFIKVAVTNHHSETVCFADPIYRRFEFSAKDSSGKLVKKRKSLDISGLFRTVATRTGTTFNGVAFINEYLDFPGPGIYTVTCRGSILMHKGLPKDQDRDTQYISLSGVVTVKLREGSVTELENVLRKYLTQLKSDDRRFRRQASQASHAFTVSQPVLAVKLLKEALMEKGRPRRSRSYASRTTWALAKIGTKQAIEALSDVALHSQRNRARVAAVIELGRFHIIESVPTLIDVLSDPSANIRVAALRSLGYIGDKSSIPEVELRFNDTDEKVRAAAREAYNILTQKKEIRKE